MTDNYASYEWFLKEDFKDYAGKWLAIVGKKIVASGTNVTDVIREVKRHYPKEKPMITKVKGKLSIL